MIHKDLQKQIGEFNSPQSRVLIMCLLVAIVAIWNLFINEKGKSDIRESRCETRVDRLQSIIDSMNIDRATIAAKVNIEIKRVSDQQDSTIKIMQKIINDIKR